MAETKKIEITDKDTGVTYVVDLKDAEISITGNVSIKVKEEPQEPGPPVKLPCTDGPDPRKISNATTTSLLLGWHGVDVHGWDWWILKGGEDVASGKIAPTGNEETITYSPLEPGDYKLVMQGNTCKSDLSEPLYFTIPKKDEPNIPPVEN